MKNDYYDLNVKQKELLKSFANLENHNQDLLSTIETVEHGKSRMKQTYESEIEKLLDDIKELTELNDHQQDELLSIHKQDDVTHTNLKQTIEALEARLTEYDRSFAQFEEYRKKLEENLDKIIQQRDKLKTDLKATQEILETKEDKYNQLKLQSDSYEKSSRPDTEQINHYKTTIHDLQDQIKKYEAQIQASLADNQVNLD